MPIGKYKGRTVAQIGLADPEYLEWCAQNLDRNIQKAAQVYLDGEPATVGAATPPAEEFNECVEPAY
jgi:hypothetical protein